jgi:hypothetical protein
MAAGEACTTSANASGNASSPELPKIADVRCNIQSIGFFNLRRDKTVCLNLDTRVVHHDVDKDGKQEPHYGRAVANLIAVDPAVPGCAAVDR